MTAQLPPTTPGWAVLIGINTPIDQNTHLPLRCPVRDAIALYVFFTHPRYTNLSHRRVLLLIDGSDEDVRAASISVVTRLQSDYGISTRDDVIDEIVAKRLPPSRADILAKVHHVAHNATPEDLLLVHFAGHGYVFDGETFLIPPDARHALFANTAVPLTFVKDEMRRSKAQRKVLLLDACHLGPAVHTSASLTNRQLIEEMFRDSEDVAIFASSLPFELSYEQDDVDGNPGHGIFTYFWLEGLSGKADEDARACLTLKDLARYVTNEVKMWVASHINHGSLQTPSLNSFGAHQGDRIVLSGDQHASGPDVGGREPPPDRRRWGRWALVAVAVFALTLAGGVLQHSRTSNSAIPVATGPGDLFDVWLRFRLKGSSVSHELPIPFKWDAHLSPSYEYVLRVRSRIDGTLFVFRVGPNHDVSRLLPNRSSPQVGIRLTAQSDLLVPDAPGWEAVGPTFGRQTFYVLLAGARGSRPDPSDWWTRDATDPDAGEHLADRLRSLVANGRCDIREVPCVVSFGFEMN